MLRNNLGLSQQRLRLVLTIEILCNTCPLSYSSVATRKMLSRHKLVLKIEKWVATDFEASRNTASISIHFNFKIFVATRKQGRNKFLLFCSK